MGEFKYSMLNNRLETLYISGIFKSADARHNVNTFNTGLDQLWDMNLSTNFHGALFGTILTRAIRIGEKTRISIAHVIRSETSSLWGDVIPLTLTDYFAATVAASGDIGFILDFLHSENASFPLKLK